jgi:hypothetical protein
VKDHDLFSEPLVSLGFPPRVLLGRASMAVPCDERLCDDLRAALETIDDLRIAADRAAR